MTQKAETQLDQHNKLAATEYVRNNETYQSLIQATKLAEIQQNCQNKASWREESLVNILPRSVIRFLLNFEHSLKSYLNMNNVAFKNLKETLSTDIMKLI